MNQRFGETYYLRLQYRKSSEQRIEVHISSHPLVHRFLARPIFEVEDEEGIRF
jgi:hypothetical protein